ncbi:unnamed protein product [Chondrus crispus]|uniref:Uncharacterized protein n=1 Tax=Chondrus crispus TaxID=2769 RepID=R7Q3L0_CHOCR|nr:unnamed protein product [Chondrus crispus]CDF32599.1 unnamed protein product [Chondrus crispus]|eukprot:XP_005712370.1 unnamed protein product [Chondrus crispus]
MLVGRNPTRGAFRARDERGYGVRRRPVAESELGNARNAQLCAGRLAELISLEEVDGVGDRSRSNRFVIAPLNAGPNSNMKELLMESGDSLSGPDLINDEIRHGHTDDGARPGEQVRAERRKSCKVDFERGVRIVESATRGDLFASRGVADDGGEVCSFDGDKDVAGGGEVSLAGFRQRLALTLGAHGVWERGYVGAALLADEEAQRGGCGWLGGHGVRADTGAGAGRRGGMESVGRRSGGGSSCRGE